MGDRLLGRERARVGLTQAAVAEALGVSQQTVARWETGRTPPSGYLRELSELLELPVAELLEQPTGKSRRRLAAARALAGRRRAVWDGADRLMPLSEEGWLTASERAAANEWTPYEYPISEKTRESLAAQLARREPGVSWLWFASLDNRIVLANLHLIEAVALISNRSKTCPPTSQQRSTRRSWPQRCSSYSQPIPLHRLC